MWLLWEQKLLPPIILLVPGLMAAKISLKHILQANLVMDPGTVLINYLTVEA